MMTTNEQELSIREFQDRGVQWLLELPENLRGVVCLLAQEIADKLDFSRAERINHTFIQEDLRKWETDLLFRIPCTDIDREVMVYLLLEHQSIPDRLMGLRVLNYMMQVWEMQRRGWAAADTPASQCWLLPVLPMVLYTGKRRWSALPTLETIMRVPEAIAPFIPRYDTLFLNLRTTPVEQLQGSAVSYALQVLQVEDAPLKELQRVLLHAVTSLEELPEEDQAGWHRVMHFLLSLIRYRRDYDEQDELTNIVTEAVRPEHREEVEEMVLTGAEFLLRQGQSEILLTLLEDKFGKLPMDVVTAVKALPIVRLKALAHQILVAQQLSDLHLGINNS